jgi:hypothetical protein
MGPAPKATNAFGDEVKVVASAYINIEILVVPCVVDAECMTARRNRKRNLVAEQKFAHEFTIKKNHDLSLGELRVMVILLLAFLFVPWSALCSNCFIATTSSAPHASQ